MNYDGVSPDDLAERVGCRELICLAAVSSTLDVIHELAGEGAPGGLVVLADEQVLGRGRQGRAWYSPKGLGIWLGYLYRPPAPLETGVLALRVGLLVARAVSGVGAAPRIKWPNDILLADRKLAGVLCEARAERDESWVAIGIGMNVHGPLPSEFAWSATALDEHRPGVTRVQVLEELVPSLNALSPAPMLELLEHEELARYDWLRDRALSDPVPGVARGVDRDGALLVETPSGIERLVAGSVVVAGGGEQQAGRVSSEE